MQKIIVNSSALLTAMHYAKKVIEKNPVVPILENFLLDVRNGRLTVSGSDLQSTFKVSMKVETKDSFQACVPVETKDSFQACVPVEIMKYLAKLEAQPITINWYPESYSVEILDEDHARAKYSGENAEDFPKAPQTDSELFEITSDLFKEFKDLLNYAHKDELRPAMTGIGCITHKGAFKMCATNGHVLKVVEVPELADANEQSEDGKQHFILPAKPTKILSDLKFGTAKKPVIEVVNVCGKYNEVLNDSNELVQTTLANVSFLFSLDGYDMELICRNIDERFPQFWNVIPTSTPPQTKYTTEKERFLKVLDKAHLFANKTTHQIRLGLNGKNKISAEDLVFSNEFCAEVGGAYEGEPIEIGFNAELLKDVVNSFGDAFTLELWAPNKAAVIREGNSLALCMPVMLNQYV